MAVLATRVERHFEISHQLMGLLMGSIGFGSLAALLGGWLADRIGCRRTFRAAVLVVLGG